MTHVTWGRAVSSLKYMFKKFCVSVKVKVEVETTCLKHLFYNSVSVIGLLFAFSFYAYHIVYLSEQIHVKKEEL